MQRPAHLLPTAALATALASAMAWPGVQAQASVAPAASTASAPDTKHARRPLSAEALRDSGTFPDDLQPETPKPQIKVPLGRKPPVPAAAPASGPVRGGAATRVPKVNEDVARCKAETTAEAREACLGRLAPADAAAPRFSR